MSDRSASTGLLAALSAVGTTLNETVRVRGALFALEWREEVQRRKRMAVLGALAFVFLHTALLLATSLVAVVFWDTHRIAALAAMSAVYAACGAAALLRLRAAAAASPTPFAATLGELERDLAELRGSR
jgi:uncharacterized membrane protein YqjE